MKCQKCGKDLELEYKGFDLQTGYERFQAVCCNTRHTQLTGENYYGDNRVDSYDYDNNFLNETNGIDIGV